MIEIGFDDDVIDRPAPAAQNVSPDREWCIRDDGLEHAASGYFIAREEIASRRGDGLWTWPMPASTPSRWSSCRASPARR